LEINYKNENIQINTTKIKNETIKIYCGTFNMAGNSINNLYNKDNNILNDLFPSNYDIYAFSCQESDNNITKLIKIYFSDYVVITSLILLEIRLILLTKEEHLSKISNVKQSSKATGFLNIIGNKGI
jgi:hypothetical protein